MPWTVQSLESPPAREAEVVLMPALGETIWDQALARHLYDAGATFEAIGANVGVLANVVSQFAKRHWPPRDPRSRPPPPPRRVRRAGRETLPPLASLQASE